MVAHPTAKRPIIRGSGAFWYILEELQVNF